MGKENKTSNSFESKRQEFEECWLEIISFNGKDVLTAEIISGSPQYNDDMAGWIWGDIFNF